MPPRRSPLQKALNGPSSDTGDESTTKSSSKQRRNRTGSTRQVSTGGSTANGEAVIDTQIQPLNARRTVHKQEVDRRNRISPRLTRAVKDAGGVPKPYDSALLRDVAAQAAAQAYIDTLAQDVAAARWDLVPRDEDANVSDEERVDAQRKLEDIHPEKSFRDILEQTTRNLLELGDAAWIKHYFEGGEELAEIVPVDSAKLFKQVDEHGLTQSYIQAEFSTYNVDMELDMREVVWFEWSSRTDHVYGHGPVEKGLDVIELLEELGDKERKDLIEGMPPGIVSAKEDADNPLPVDEYETVKEEFGLSEGERHRIIVSRGEWDYTDFSGNYQELQVLERNKFWIHVLGAVFKCNAPYAGFDFQEGNRAQNEAQAEAYAQRGFRQTLRQVEEAITRQLVHEDLTEELDFRFEREQTTQERKEQTDLLAQAANAAEAWAQNGRTVSVNEDGTISVEPGDVEPEDVESPADEGGGGGLFGSTDASIKGDNHVRDGEVIRCEHSGETFQPDVIEANNEECPACGEVFAVDEVMLKDGEEVALSEDELLRKDEILLDAYKTQIWPESIDQIDKQAWGGDMDVPEYVKEAIEEAIDGGAVFQNIKGLPGDVRRELEDLLKDALTQPQGWSLDSVVDNMRDIWPGVDREELEVVARTETASVLNEAREEGYEDRPESGRYRFKWVGPDDARTTEACTFLKQGSSAVDEAPENFAGTENTAVTMSELKRLQQEAVKFYFPNLNHRDHVIHPNERHTFVRAVDDEGLSDVPSAEDVVTDEERQRRAEEAGA